jgi:hypothetical protein
MSRPFVSVWTQPLLLTRQLRMLAAFSGCGRIAVTGSVPLAQRYTFRRTAAVPDDYALPI